MAVQLIMQNALTLGHWDRPVKSYDQILFWPQSAVFSLSKIRLVIDFKNGHILPTGQWYAPSAVKMMH